MNNPASPRRLFTLSLRTLFAVVAGTLGIVVLVPLIALAALVMVARWLIYPDRRAHFYFDKGSPELEPAERWLRRYAQMPWRARIARLIRKRRLTKTIRRSRIPQQQTNGPN